MNEQKIKKAIYAVAAGLFALSVISAFSKYGMLIANIIGGAAIMLTLSWLVAGNKIANRCKQALQDALELTGWAGLLSIGFVLGLGFIVFMLKWFAWLGCTVVALTLSLVLLLLVAPQWLRDRLQRSKPLLVKAADKEADAKADKEVSAASHKEPDDLPRIAMF